MNKNEIITVEISNEVAVEVQPNESHEWLISTADVAEGYGLSAGGIRKSKERYSDELEEGKHFVTKRHETQNQGGRPSTYWTKKGVVRLGFLIKTPLAKQFRDWAEDYIIKKSEEEPKALPTTYLEALEDLVAKERLLLEQAPVVETYKKLVQSSLNILL